MLIFLQKGSLRYFFLIGHGRSSENGRVVINNDERHPTFHLLIVIAAIIGLGKYAIDEGMRIEREKRNRD